MIPVLQVSRSRTVACPTSQPVRNMTLSRYILVQEISNIQKRSYNSDGIHHPASTIINILYLMYHLYTSIFNYCYNYSIYSSFSLG